jgi:hypothetical protein
MFLSELIPIAREFAQQPIAFIGGFISGAMHLNLTEEPLKAWLAKQNIFVQPNDINNNHTSNNSPQNIAIE